MTNHWIDLKNADVILLLGSNAAENHPISWKWIEEARKNRNAKVIVVDPRVSRSAARADLYGRIRSGTDIAFVGGLINYALTYGKINQSYLLNYSNIAYLITDGTDELGVANGSRDFRGSLSSPFTGVYPGMSTFATSAVPKYDTTYFAHKTGSTGPVRDPAFPAWPATPDPDSVLALLRSHYSRYSPTVVSRITGMSETDFLKIADAYCSTYEDGKSGTIMYAMGTTQHTVGVQNVRSYSILQMLLGNMGVAGGGINALRGESNVQGSTDQGLLYHIIPGYIATQTAAMQTFGLQTATATVKNSSALTAPLTAGTAAGSMIIGGLAGVTSAIRAGDSIRVTGGAADAANSYTIESVINATTVRITRLAGLINAWSVGNAWEIRSESTIDHTKVSNSFLAARTPVSVAGTTDILGYQRLSSNWWQNTPKYMMSMLAAWWGKSTHFANNADNTEGGQYAYNFMPKIDPARNYSHISIFEHIKEVADLGASAPPQMLMCWGTNPAVGGPQSVFEREQLAKLNTLVCIDLWETETAAFWKADPASTTGGSFGVPSLTPALINTTVYLLPAKASMEKEGSISNSGRWLQWRYTAEDGGTEVQVGQAKSDLSILNDLMIAIKAAYATPTPLTVGDGLGITELTWGFETNGYGLSGTEADARAVAREMNGFVIENPGTTGATKKLSSQINGFPSLTANVNTSVTPNTMTACGNWLHCGSWIEPSADVLAPQTGNYAGCRMAKMVPVDNSASGIGLFADWSWSWPLNRRIIYNRASMKPVSTTGDRYVPYQSDKWVLKWNYTAGAFAPGGDVPDGFAANAPEQYLPFIMKNHGMGTLFGQGLVDGPLPEHYEPAETPCTTHPLGATHIMWNPIVLYKDYIAVGTDFKQYQVTLGDAATYPVVGSTFRLVEHWQAGAMTRNLPWLAELQPDMFCEMSEEFAAANSIINGDRVQISTARNTTQPLDAVALVTKRVKPFQIWDAGSSTLKTVHQVGLPWHFGFRGIAQGGSANLLTVHLGDPNTRIPEYKAFMCKVVKV